MKKAIFIQGLYYIATGLWPLIHLQSFLWITGPKQDQWLVKLVGLLAITIGTNLLARRSALLACMTALSFAAIDTLYAFNGTLSYAYLIDAAVQGQTSTKIPIYNVALPVLRRELAGESYIIVEV